MLGFQQQLEPDAPTPDLLLKSMVLGTATQASCSKEELDVMRSIPEARPSMQMQQAWHPLRFASSSLEGCSVSMRGLLCNEGPTVHCISKAWLCEGA